jgi:hypothetical protein
MKDLIAKLKIGKQIKRVTSLQTGVPDVIDADTALALHIKFWQVKTIISDMYIKVRRYELGKKLDRDTMLVDLKSESEEKSEAAKERYAMAQESWRKLQGEAKEAEVLREWLELKREDFSQAIYVTRTLLEQYKQDKNSMPNGNI